MSELALPTAPRRSGDATVFLLVGIAILELVVFILAIAMGVRGTDVLVLLMALTTAFVGALPVVLDMGRRREERQILITLLSLVYMVFIVVPIFTNYFPLKGEDLPGFFNLAERTPTQVLHAQVVALGGLLMLLAGFYLPFGRFLASPIPRPTREWSPGAALTVSLITLGLGWLVYVAGQANLIPKRAGSGALGTVASGSFFGVSLLALTWLRHRRREVLPFLVVIVLASMFFNFFTGSKRLFLTPPFMVALAYVVYERRIRKSWVVAGLAMLVVVYPISEFYRQAIQTDRVRSARIFLQNPLGVLSDLSRFSLDEGLTTYLTTGLEASGNRLDALGTLAVIVKDTPERVPYQGGWTIGLIAVSYVPRILWPGKPATTTGEWVGQTYGSPYDLVTDVGPSWIGELYFNWGYAGVALGMFLMGMLLRMLQERLFQPNAPIPALFGAVVVLYCASRSVQASLMAPINGTIYNLAPIPIAHVLVGLFGGYYRPRDPSPDGGSSGP